MVDPDAAPRRTIVTYAGFDDPSPAEAAAVRQALADFRYEEIVPGTYSVLEPPEAVIKALSSLTDNWKIKGQGTLSSRPPRVGTRRKK